MERAEKILGRKLKYESIHKINLYNIIVFATQSAHKRFHEGKAVDNNEILHVE